MSASTVQILIGASCEACQLCGLYLENDHIPNNELPSPVGYGWTQEADEQMKIQWTQGNLLPQKIVDVLDSASISKLMFDSNPAADSDAYVEPVEEDCEIDNNLDMVFMDDEEYERD